MLKIILASRSPRRKELLKFICPRFDIIFPEADEYIESGIHPRDVAIRLCALKAESVKKAFTNNSIVITADTVVSIAGKTIGKPGGFGEAVEMLSFLSGKMHEVFTAVRLNRGLITESFCVRSEVFMKKITRRQIREYVTKYRPYDKAGAYGIQELMPAKISFSQEPPVEKIEYIRNEKRGVSWIAGSYTNVMGLPLTELFIKINCLRNLAL